MSRELFVHLLPRLFEPADLEGGIAVVIDVLRASTTIVHALAAGAERVIPCGSVDESRATAADCAPGSALLGGEREGRKIVGFDLDNSPLAYTADTVRGKTVVFSTTNGTQALLRAQRAKRVIVGAFVNLHAVLQCLLGERGPIHLICAGTDGQITLEDILFAGAIARGITFVEKRGEWQDDAAQLAVNLFDTRSRRRADFRDTMRSSRGGRNLVELGYDADIERSSEWDLFPIVPELSREPWQIQAARNLKPIQERWMTPPE